jgi:Tfp pilus assembly protein PilN
MKCKWYDGINCHRGVFGGHNKRYFMLLPTNPFSKTNHFGVSLSANSIRGLAVGSNGAILNFVEVPLSEPLTDSDRDMTKNISETMKQVKLMGKFNSNYAAVTIPEKFAFSREYTMNHVEPQEINEAISWQIEKIFPFQKKDIYWDWKLLAFNKTETKVLVTAMQKRFLDQLNVGFEQAGLFTISFEPSASALSRLVPSSMGKRLIIIEVESMGTTATLVSDGISTLTTTTIISHTTPPQLVWQDMINSLNTLLEKFQQLNQAKQSPVIILTGEKATDKLATMIQNYLKVQTQVLQVTGISAAYHLAYVAAVSTIEPPTSELTINLLPTRLQEYYRAQVKRNVAQATLRIIAILMVVGLAIQIIGLGMAWWQNRSLNNQIALEQQQPLPQGPQGINLSLVQKQAQRFTQLFPKKTTPESSLAELMRILPAGITISSVSIDTQKGLYALSGVAESRTNVLALKQAIDATDKFTKVILPLTALENASDYNFLLTFNIKPSKP